MKYKKKKLPQYGLGGLIGTVAGAGLGIGAAALAGQPELMIPLATAGSSFGGQVGGQIDDINFRKKADKQQAKIEEMNKPMINPILPYGEGGKVKKYPKEGTKWNYINQQGDTATTEFRYVKPILFGDPMPDLKYYPTKRKDQVGQGVFAPDPYRNPSDTTYFWQRHMPFGSSIDDEINYMNTHQIKQTPKMREGGQVGQQMINVEGQELEVDPKGNIVKDFKNKPPHPIQGIDPRGNILATEGNIIIPKKLRNSYLTADRQKRKAILASLNMFNTTNKYDGNNGSKVGDYSDPTGNKDWTYSWGTPLNGQPQLYGYSKGKEYPLSGNPKFKSSVDLFTNKYNTFQTAGGGGSTAWDNYIQSNNQSTPQSTPYQHRNFTYPNTALNYNAPAKTAWNGGAPKTPSMMNVNNIPNTGLGTYTEPTTPTTAPREGTDWNNVANNIIPYIGDLAQLGYNLFSKPKYPSRMRNKEYMKSIDLMSGRRYDISGQLRSNREGLGAFNYAVRNSSGGNAGMYLNQMSAGQNNFNSANSNAWAMKNNADNGYKGEEAQFRAGLGAQDTAYGYQFEDDKLQAEATRRNNMFGAAQDIGQNYMKMNSYNTIDEYAKYLALMEGKDNNARKELAKLKAYKASQKAKKIG